jgi:hypothetical protein
MPFRAAWLSGSAWLHHGISPAALTAMGWMQTAGAWRVFEAKDPKEDTSARQYFNF